MGKTRRNDTAERSERELIQELKAKLRGKDKEIARLRKELGRREDLSEQVQDLLEAETETALESKKKISGCPKCGADVTEIPIGKFTLDRCTSCTWRARRK